MTTNQSAKARLFALYLGQEVQYPSLDGKLTSNKLVGVSFDSLILNYSRKKNGCIGEELSFKSNGVHDTDALHAVLILRSIADLTDEELCVLAKHSAYILDEKNIHTIGRVMAKHLMELNRWSGTTILILTDYLRSIGIALPVTVLEDGKPVTYSVEQQVELKWIKINQPK